MVFTCRSACNKARHIQGGELHLDPCSLKALLLLLLYSHRPCVVARTSHPACRRRRQVLSSSRCVGVVSKRIQFIIPHKGLYNLAFLVIKVPNIAIRRGHLSCRFACGCDVVDDRFVIHREVISRTPGSRSGSTVVHEQTRHVSRVSNK